MDWRPVLVRLHRGAGLALAPFLFVAGLSGAIIAFTDELDGWLNPDLRTTPSAGPFGSPFDFIERIEARDPRGQVTFATLAFRPGESALYFVKPRLDPATGRPYRLDYNQVFVDPTTGEILGRRRWGAFAFDREHLLPAVYEIHYSLFLPEVLSGWFLGVIALVWLFDSCVGASLTLPRTRPRLRRWLPAWTIKPGGGSYRFAVDLHRAAGLWLWGVLILLAATGFYLRVGDDVVRPLLLEISSLTPTPYETRPEHPPHRRPHQQVGYREAAEIGGREAELLGWAWSPGGAFYDAPTGVYALYFHAPAYAGRNIGSPTIFIDGTDGHVLGHSLPLEGSFADVVVDLPRPLHGGKIAGLPGRILVAATGVLTAMLAVTGVVIWLRKRRARRLRRHGPTAA